MPRCYRRLAAWSLFRCPFMISMCRDRDKIIYTSFHYSQPSWNVALNNSETIQALGIDGKADSFANTESAAAEKPSSHTNTHENNCCVLSTHQNLEPFLWPKTTPDSSNRGCLSLSVTVPAFQLSNLNVRTG